MKNKITSLFFLSLVALLFAFITENANSQVPYQIKHFSASKTNNSQLGNVNIYWMPDYSSNSAQVKGFYLYKREVVQNSYLNTKIGKFVIDLSLRDSVPTVVGLSYLSDDNGSTWSAYANFKSYSTFTLDTLYANLYHRLLAIQTTYSLYMTAYGDMGESPISNVVQITSTYHDSTNLHFTSTPVTTGYKDENYQYDAEATFSGSGTLSYSLANAPSGMTINSTTGLVSWTPTVAGKYSYAVEATVTHSDGTTSKLSQTVTLTILSCRIQATITGNVKDENGNPVNNAYTNVYAVKAGSNSQNSFTAKVVNGSYSISVDAGVYNLYFPSTNYHHGCWYQNVSTQDSAVDITVDCGDSLRMNDVIMSTYVTPHHYQVSGTVTDSLNNPIPYAYVRFMTVDANVSYTFTATTSSTGAYTISLYDTYTYIAVATAVHDTTNNTVNYYLPQYFNLTSDRAQATTFKLTANRNDINFILTPQPTYNNSLSGTVVDGDGTAQPNVYVIAYMIDSFDNNYHYYHISSVMTNSAGAYSISNLIPGKYVLMCVPSNRSNSAGYYKVNDFTVQSWQDATQLDVTSSSQTTNVTIKIVKRQVVQGTAGVSGMVSNHNGVLKNSDIPMASSPISGAIVYALNSKNEVVDYTLTDKDGKYKISGLSSGSYQILSDRVGFIKSKTPINLTNTIIDIPFSLIPLDMTDVEEVTVTNSKIKVYPNPTSDFIIIGIEDNDTYTATILDISGKELISKSNLTFGENRISLRELATGSYIVNIESKNNITSKVVFKK